MALSAFGVEDNRLSKADDGYGEAAVGGGAGAAAGGAAAYGLRNTRMLPRKKRNFTPNVQKPLQLPRVLGGREVELAPNQFIRTLRRIPKGSGRLAAGAALGGALGAGAGAAAHRKNS